MTIPALRGWRPEAIRPACAQPSSQVLIGALDRHGA